MARSRTIAELEQAIRWQADYERADLRHTSADVRLAINNSIQSFREAISGEGYHYFLTSHSGTLPIGLGTHPDTGVDLAYGVLDTASFDPEVVRIYGFDVSISNFWQELSPVSFKERNWQQTLQNHWQYPQNYFMFDETKIAILPPSQDAYEYLIYYLPVLPQLTADDDTFNPGVPNGDEWIIWDVMMKLVVRDNYPDLYGVVSSKRNELMTDILHKAAKLQASEPIKRINTRDQRRSKIGRWFLYGNRS